MAGDNEPPKNDRSTFLVVFFSILGVAIFCALCQIGVTVFEPDAPRFERLVDTFKWGWVVSIGALVGLFGGKAIG